MPQEKDPIEEASNPSNDEILSLAKRTLRAICDDVDAGASARVGAARTLLELAGAIKNSQQDQGLTQAREMTVDEIDRRLAQLDAAASTPAQQSAIKAQERVLSNRQGRRSLAGK